MRFDIVGQEQDRLGFTHYRYQEYIGNVKIEGAEWTVSSNAKGITFASGNLIEMPTTLPSPTIDGIGAVQIAQSVIGADTYKWEVPQEEIFIKQLTGDPLATFFPTAETVCPIFN